MEKKDLQVDFHSRFMIALWILDEYEIANNMDFSR
jgi:hypothetical protein